MNVSAIGVASNQAFVPARRAVASHAPAATGEATEANQGPNDGDGDGDDMGGARAVDTRA